MTWDPEKSFQSWNRRLHAGTKDIADRKEFLAAQAALLIRLSNDSRLDNDLRRESRRMGKALQVHVAGQCQGVKRQDYRWCTYCESDHQWNETEKRLAAFRAGKPSPI